MSAPANHRRSSLIPAVGRVVGGLAGAKYGSAASLAGTEIGQAVASLIEDLKESRQRRAEHCVVLAVEFSALTPEEFTLRIRSRAERQEVFGRTLDAATRAIAENKIVALADVLASAALTDDSAQLSLDLLIARALEDVEGPHLEVLDYLYPRQNRKVHIWNDRVPLHENARRWSTADLKQSSNLHFYGPGLPHLAPGLDGLLATLQRHGLIVLNGPDWKDRIRSIEQAGRVGGANTMNTPTEEWSITEFGCTVFDLIQQANEFLNTRPQAEQST